MTDSGVSAERQAGKHGHRSYLVAKASIEAF
jgi:hypothetical protein